jgi:hypothetical protein
MGSHTVTGPPRSEFRFSAPSMPGAVDGWGVLWEMRDDPRLRGAPVCVMTGLADPPILPPGTRVLRKPLPFANIREVVEEHCGIPTKR